MTEAQISEERFIEICVEEGYIEEEAIWMLMGRPEGMPLIEDVTRETAREFLPALIKRREEGGDHHYEQP